MRSNKYLRIVSLLAILVIGGLLISGCAPNIRKLEEKQDIEGLIKALNYIENDVRKDAALALGRVGDSHAVEPLIKALEDEDEVSEVRKYAASSLGLIGDNRAIEPLIKALGDEDEDVRGYAAQALGEIGDSRAVEPLIKALRDEKVVNGYSIFRLDAANALGNIGEAAISPLIKILRDEDEDLIMHTKEALGYIGEPAVEPLIEALEDEDVRSEAAEVLIKIGDERAIDPLISVLYEYKDKDIAEYFLNCGHPQLEEAAAIWAKNNGYEIIRTPGGGGPSWGSSSK